MVDPCSETDDMNRSKQATNKAVGRSENLGRGTVSDGPELTHMCTYHMRIFFYILIWQVQHIRADGTTGTVQVDVVRLTRMITRKS